MPDERTDRARTITSHFIEDLNSLDSPESFKQFALRYFSDANAKEFIFNVVATAELSGRKLNDWPAFKRFFSWKSYQQFSKRTSQLKDLDSELGFMSR